jgi:carbamoyl-phosphate synthase small subunit
VQIGLNNGFYFLVFLMNEKRRAKLVLEDNTVFFGESFGANCSRAGEVVFNTGMVGYPETLTDPSYYGQILVLSFPLIGNYGVPLKQWENGLFNFFESDKIHLSGLIVSNYCNNFSHWSAVKSLGQWLKEQGIPAITGIDTRALILKIRSRGVMLGKIVIEKDVNFFNPNNKNLVEFVSEKKIISYGEGRKKIVLIDCGVKNSIIRCLIKRKVKILRVPWNFPLMESGLDFDGIVISNGPGNPKQCVETINTIKKALSDERPIFGICLGNQLLALAAGANTFKLKFGHRSQNQPCNLIGSKRCFITSQNHGFAVSKSLPKGWIVWFENGNDKTIEGIRHKSKPFMAVQFHPEGNPGPNDTEFLFDEFLKEV